MNDFNKLKLPDDWADDYESPITLAFQEIANKIMEERDDRIVAEISEQMDVNVDKHELARALAYDRDQYRKGFEAAWLAREKDVMTWIPVSERLPHKNMACLVSVGKLNLVQIAMYSNLMETINHRIFWQGEYGKNNFQNITEYVNAWMPLPEPYKKPEQLGGES